MSLFLRNLFFTLLQPGIVAGFIPYWIIKNNFSAAFTQPFDIYHIVGSLIFLIGFIIMLICIVHLAVHGRGTLSPADPTKKLVIKGPYRFSRNPMYIGVMLMLIGECVFFQSGGLAIYAIIIFIAFYTFVISFEEPRLQKDFGDEYGAYRKKVRRWI